MSTAQRSVLGTKTVEGMTPGRRLRGRAIVRRRALPSGRAVTGGFLMALAALGVFVAARGAAEKSTQNYVVTAHDLLFIGQVIALPAVTR